MWYAICIAVGLALGLAMMIWALTERSKRHTAEENLIKKQVEVDEAKKIADGNADAVKEVKKELGRVEAAMGVLKSRLDTANEMLLKCSDPATVKAWLDAESKAEVL